jgi:hypothetical protein
MSLGLTGLKVARWEKRLADYRPDQGQEDLRAKEAGHRLRYAPALSDVLVILGEAMCSVTSVSLRDP